MKEQIEHTIKEATENMEGAVEGLKEAIAKKRWDEVMNYGHGFVICASGIAALEGHLKK